MSRPAIDRLKKQVRRIAPVPDTVFAFAVAMEVQSSGRPMMYSLMTDQDAREWFEWGEQFTQDSGVYAVLMALEML